MPTLLDGVLESHTGPEPRIRTSDVQAVLKRRVDGGADSGKSVALIAARAKVSTRTVYRVLQGDKPTVSLKLGDALVMACDSHPRFTCNLVWPDGRVTPYTALDVAT